VRKRRRILLIGLALVLLLACGLGAALDWPQPSSEAEQKAGMIDEGMSFDQVAAMVNSNAFVPPAAPKDGPGYIDFGWSYDDYSVLYVSFGSPEVGPLRVVAVRTTPPVSRLRRELEGLFFLLGK
jgi:hypothetical protein